MKPLKTATDVLQLVAELMAASPDVMAIGHDGYCVIDLDRPKASRKITRILETFGPRDHLYYEIIAELRANGRFIDPQTTSPAH